MMMKNCTTNMPLTRLNTRIWCSVLGDPTYYCVKSRMYNVRVMKMDLSCLGRKLQFMTCQLNGSCV